MDLKKIKDAQTEWVVLYPDFNSPDSEENILKEGFSTEEAALDFAENFPKYRAIILKVQK